MKKVKIFGKIITGKQIRDLVDEMAEMSKGLKDESIQFNADKLQINLSALSILISSAFLLLAFCELELPKAHADVTANLGNAKNLPFSIASLPVLF